MEREQALELLHKHVKNKNLRKHCYAVEAICRRIAQEMGEDEEKWALAGLLHDIDYDQTADNPEQHSVIGAGILAKHGLPEDVVYAVKVHNERHGFPRLSLLDKVLYAADPLSGLIVAAALIHPDKKLASISAESVMRRFDERSFARGADRDQIRSCSEFGMDLERFVALGYEAMAERAADLGL